MKKILGLLLLCLNAAAVNAETFATQPNKAGGKIVLTDETCKHNGKVYDKLNRAYNYGSEGYTSEGCWVVEGETIVILWIETEQKMRYPLENFTLNPNWKAKKNGYKY